MALTRTTLTDDDGSGTTGTVLNNAWLQTVYDAIEGSIGKPRCQATHSTQQSIPSGTDTPVRFDTDVYDASLMHSSTSTSLDTRFSVPDGKGGAYYVGANIFFSVVPGPGQRVLAYLRKNGATRLSPYTGYHGSTVGVTAVFTGGVFELSTGDYVEAIAWQETGGALNLGNAAGGVNGSVFSIMKVG
jgi:hypothetical protein